MKSNNLTTRVGAMSLGAIVLASLSACGGGSSHDPVQKYREQTLQWTECDPTILGTMSPVIAGLWAQAGDRLRCSVVKAPLDWGDAGRGDVAISVMRVAAGVPEKRRGALFFNPGGPGADGLNFAFSLFHAFSGSNPDSPQGARQLQLLNEYDMVGFSPRGTGSSTQLTCGTNEMSRLVHSSAAEWDTPENIANANYNGSKTAEACLKNPVTPYINTDATARDMDLMRGLLGDEKLNYVGYSYGTWLGAWYASLFPEKVGRMVLDSSTDFTATLEQSVFLGQPPARQRLLEDVMVPYAVRHADVFGLGATDAEVRANLPSLSPKMQQVVGSALSRLGYSRTSADEYLNTIAAARGLDILLKAAPNPSDPEAVGDALDGYVFDVSDAARDKSVRNIAENLFQTYAFLWIQPKPESISLNPEAAVLTAVHCNDTAATTDLTVWAELVRGLAQRAPMFFAGMLEVHSCAFWGGPKVNKPDLTPMKQLDVLFVQSQYDSATYTEGANAFFAQLPGARRAYVPGDFQHGVYPYTDACVDPLVTDYLLGESPKVRETVCTAHPLAQDAPKPSANQQTSSADRVTGTPPVYKDPEQARKQLEEFKRGLIPSNQRR